MTSKVLGHDDIQYLREHDHIPGEKNRKVISVLLEGTFIISKMALGPMV